MLQMKKEMLLVSIYLKFFLKYKFLKEKIK